MVLDYIIRELHRFVLAIVPLIQVSSPLIVSYWIHREYKKPYHSQKEINKVVEQYLKQEEKKNHED